jgi:fibronectin-binding autotransporter adhesin
MSGSLNVPMIPTVPKQAAAAETFNVAYRYLNTHVTAHYLGNESRHLVTELDSPSTDDHVTAPPLTVNATDQHTRNLQLLTLIGQIADPTVTSISAFDKVAQLVTAGINMKALGSAITQRTPNATPNTTVSRGTVAEAAFGSLTAFGFGTQNAVEFKARPVTGQTVPVLVVENQAGTQTKWNVDGAGSTFQAANATIQGVIIAGSGAIAITTAAGNLDATKLSGSLPASLSPQYTGDVTKPAGSLVTTVAAVGTKTATAVATAVGKVETASAAGTASMLAQFNATGGMTFTGTVIAPTFQGALTGSITGNAATATNVAATGITGTILAAQIDTAIARVANVPTNAGAGATGTWGISVTGNAGTATIASAVIANAISSDMLQPLSVTSSKLALGALSLASMADGAVSASSPPDKRVNVASLDRINGAGVIFPSVAGPVDLSADIASLTLGQNRYELIAVNGQGNPIGVPGQATTGVLGAANMPTVGVDTAPLAIVTLRYQQGSILQTDIRSFKDAFSFWGSAATSGGSIPGHIHGQTPGEQPQPAFYAFLEGRAHATNTLSKNIVIEPFCYASTAGIVTLKGQTTIAIPDVSSGISVFRVYLLRSTGAIIVDGEVNGVSLPAFPGFNLSLHVPICYAVNRFQSAYIRGYDQDDNLNGYLKDARVWMATGGTGGTGSGATVPDGGTGQTTFNQGLIWQAHPTNGATPLATIAATTDGTRGLAISPQLNGPLGGVTVYQTEDGGIINNAAAPLARMVNRHILSPVKSGSTATEAVSLQVEAGAGATANASAVFVGNIRVGGIGMPTVALDVTGAITATGVITGGSFSTAGGINVGATTVASLTVTGAATVGTTLGVTGVSTLQGNVRVGSAAAPGVALDVTGQVRASLGLVATTGGLLVSAGGADITGAALLKNGVTVSGAASTFTTTAAFNAGLTGTTGNFSGQVNGTAGVFSGAVSGASYSGGAINGTTGGFTGNVVAPNFTVTQPGGVFNTTQANADLNIPGTTVFPGGGDGVSSYRRDQRTWFGYSATDGWCQLGIPVVSTLPASPATNYRAVRATDQFQFRWNGSAWVKQGTARQAMTNFELPGNQWSGTASTVGYNNATAPQNFVVEDTNSIVECRLIMGVTATAASLVYASVNMLIDGVYYAGPVSMINPGQNASISGTVIQHFPPGTFAAGNHSITAVVYTNGVASLTLVVGQPYIWRCHMGVTEYKP